MHGPCPYCETGIPRQIQLVIANVVDGLLCAVCDENLNTTFVLDWIGFQPSISTCCYMLFRKSLSTPMNCQTFSISLDPIYNNYCDTEATPATCIATAL